MNAHTLMEYLNNREITAELRRIYREAPRMFDAYANSVDNDEVLRYLSMDFDRALRFITFEFLNGRLDFQATSKAHGLPRKVGWQ